MGEPDDSRESETIRAGAQRGCRFVVGLFALNCFWIMTVWPQRSQTFGQRYDAAIGPEVRALVVSPQLRASPPEIALLSFSPSTVSFFRAENGGSLVPTDTCAVPTGSETLLTADLDGTGRPSFITMDGSTGQVCILRRTPDGGFSQSILSVPPAQRLIVADINNDGKPDLLLFGRTTAGVTTFLNRRAGVFVRGPVLFPDISVGDLQVRDLDGDGVNDVFLLDWLSNKLDIFYGIARTVFSEQLAISLPGEPGALSVGQVSAARTVRIAVTIPASRKILLYDGNALGDFRLSATVECPSPPEGLLLKDIDGDGLPEIVSGTTRGILLRLGSPTPWSERTQFFAPPAGTNMWAVEDVDGDGKPDLVAVDRRTRSLTVEFNDARQASPSEIVVYAVGVDPRGVAIADVDRDGRADILVANQRSNTTSVLFNRGNGQFSAQSSTAVGESPSCVTPLEGEVSGFVVSGGLQGQVHLVTYQETRTNSLTVAMQRGGNPEVLEASFNPREGRIEIMLRTHEEAGRGVMLTSLEQLSRRQFLERAIRPSIASIVLAATARHRNQNLAVLYATNDNRTGRTTVYTSTATPEFKFSSLRSLFSYPDSTMSTFLLSWGVTGSDTLSIAAVALGEPADMIGVFVIKGDTLATPVQWIKGFRPLDDSAMTLEDVDGDGLPDLVVADAVRRTVYLFRGEYDFGFYAPIAVTSVARLGDFAVGHLRNSPGSDLVLTDRRSGTVRILLDAFRRQDE